MFKKLVVTVVLNMISISVYASDVGECIQRSNIYGYSVTYGPEKVTLSLGKYGRARYSANYKLVKLVHGLGGYKEYYEHDLHSPIPPLRAWPTNFEMHFFNRIANHPSVSLIFVYSGGASKNVFGMNCKF